MGGNFGHSWLMGETNLALNILFLAHSSWLKGRFWIYRIRAPAPFFFLIFFVKNTNIAIDTYIHLLYIKLELHLGVTGFYKNDRTKMPLGQKQSKRSYPMAGLWSFSFVVGGGPHGNEPITWNLLYQTATPRTLLIFLLLLFLWFYFSWIKKKEIKKLLLGL